MALITGGFPWLTLLCCAVVLFVPWLSYVIFAEWRSRRKRSYLRPRLWELYSSDSSSSQETGSDVPLSQQRRP